MYLIRLMSVSMMYAAGSESPHPTPLNTLPMSMNGKEEAVVTKIHPVSSTEKKNRFITANSLIIAPDIWGPIIAAA